MIIEIQVEQTVYFDVGLLTALTRKLAVDIADELARQVKLALIRVKAVATGKTLQSVRREELLSIPSRIEFRQNVLARDVWKEIQGGRSPGRLPLDSEMREWFLALNIPRGAWFPIRRAIQRKGIKPRDIVGLTLKNSQTRIKNLLEIYARQVAAQLVKVKK